MQIDTISRKKLYSENTMQQPDDINCIFALYSCGWGSKRIAKELAISRGTVKKYLRQGAWLPASPRRNKKLEGLEEWLKKNFEQHRGNCDVIRQELKKEHQITVSLRTIERAVKKWRRENEVQAKATARFETAPGKQLQIDFGSTGIIIGEKKIKVFLFVATLGYSRRVFVKPFLHERQTAWFRGIEEAFYHFEGITEELLMDNAKALVNKHDIQTRTVLFSEKFKAFADYWGFNPRACRPYRARTKGKDERMVGYVKRNAIAGHTFPHFEALEQHLQNWMVSVADQRIHTTTGEPPAERFHRDEKSVLKPPIKPSFIKIRELKRKVHRDACVELDTNHYSVPSKFIGEEVMLEVSDGILKIFYEETEISTHILSTGKKERCAKKEHLIEVLRISRASHEDGICGRNSELLRSLSEYQQVAGGGW